MVALRPDIIILDEATSMLDPEGRAEVIATIQKIKEESNLTVISITHDIDEAANANRILVMRQGQLTNEGTPEKIFSAGEALVEMGLDLPFPEKLKSSFERAWRCCANELFNRRRDGGLVMDIRFKQVDFTYQPNTPFEQRALFDINLTIQDGSYTAIVGHTGRWQINVITTFECFGETN